MRHALALALVLIASTAHADVVPEGQRYVPVAHTLSGTAALKDYKLFLVTVNDRMRNHVRVQADIGDGPLSIPDGYRASSYLVALTPKQVAELDAVRDGKWSDEPSDERAPPSKFRAFFDRKDVASSVELDFRDLVDRGSDTKSITRAWTVVKVEGDKIVMTLPEPKHDGGSLVPFFVAGGAALLAAFAVLALRRRRVAALA